MKKSPCSILNWSLVLFVSFALKSWSAPVELILTTIKENASVSVERLTLEGEINQDPLTNNFFVLTNREGTDIAETALGTGIYKALYLATLVKGKPFNAFHVTLKTVPPTNSSESTATLALGLLALGEGITLPADVAILGDLYPDGTLKPVSAIQERIEALLDLHVKKIIIPALQTGIMKDKDTFLVLNDLAIKRQATCIPVANLQEAAQVMWPMMIFPKPVQASVVSSRIESQFLKARVASLIVACQEEKEAKVKKHQTEKPSPISQPFFQNAAENMDMGISASKSGNYFAAYEQLQRALSQYRIARLSESTSSISLTRLQEESKKLLKEFDTFERSKALSGSVSESYGYFQTHHVLSVARGQLLGSENLVRKILTARKDSDSEAVKKALFAYASALEESRILATTMQDYETLVKSDENTDVERENNNVMFLSQVAGRAFMDGGEHFFYQMQKFPQELRPYLLYENGFYNQLTNLLDAKTKTEFIYGLSHDIQTRRLDNLHAAPFTPGAGYISPEQVSNTLANDQSQPHPMPLLMAYLNQISDQSLLEFQLTESDSKFDDTTKTWTFHRGIDLIMVLDQASKQAQQSLALFREMEISSIVPELIFQRAQILASMPSERMKLNGLREYWRCSQACLISKALYYAPPAQRVTPADYQKMEKVTIPISTPSGSENALGALYP